MRNSWINNSRVRRRDAAKRSGRRKLARSIVGVELLEQRRLLASDLEQNLSELGQSQPAAIRFTIPNEPALAARLPLQSTPDVLGTPPFPLSDTFLLHSQVGATKRIYLDFDGHTTSGTQWNSDFTNNAPFATPAFDLDGNPAQFNDLELEAIQLMWQRVSEDYIPFGVDVTTEVPGAGQLVNSGAGDNEWGVRVVIGGDGSWNTLGAGGLAYVGSFGFSIDYGVFAFSELFNGSSADIAEVISHEAGHSLGLDHDGRTIPDEEYYGGHGAGETSWGPIMGAAYGNNLTTWSRGEYLNASNQEDDLAIIVGANGFGYRSDDHGNGQPTATNLQFAGDGSILDEGIIERNLDVDVFKFSTGAGPITINIDPFYLGPNLDILAELFDSNGLLVASSNPADQLNATISATVDSGTYYLWIDGVGKGDALGTGYTDYGSLGYYSITGTIVEATDAQIRGVKWNDLDRDGVRDSGEAGIGGFTIFLDANNNGQRDSGERSTVTGADGSYRFQNLNAGQYRVVEVQQVGWSQSFPAGDGTHVVTVGNSEIVTGINFGNYGVGGSISGIKYNDLNGNSKQDIGEPGIGGVFIYVDLNKDGVIGAGEPAAKTNSKGKYRIEDVSIGTFQVREVVNPGWTPTYPATVSGRAQAQVVTVAGDVSGVNFGNRESYDFGDAPASYKTNVAGKAASHGVVPSFRLGGAVDGELNGTPSIDAQGDNTNGVNDEDGVLFVSKIKAGRVTTIQVNASTSVGYLQGWIDFNGDGDWKDAGEQIFKDKLLAAGNNILTFTVPANAVQGTTFARFRYGVERGISYFGAAKLGEVEDYQISIPQAADNGVVALSDRYLVTEDSANNPLDVLQNDFERNGAPLTIVSVGPTSDGGSVSIINGTSLSYTPDGDFFGTETFTYTVSTADGRIKTALVFVDVLGVNDAPIALDDTLSATQGTATSLDVLANDSDADGDNLLITAVGPLSNGGTATIAPNGKTINYTSAGGFTGDESFTYTISDGNGGTATASVTVSVFIAPIEPVLEYELVITDTTVNRNVISTATVGQTFVLQVYANDLRTTTATGQNGGAFSSYLDVAYDLTKVAAVVGSITYPGAFTGAPSGTIGDSPNDADLIPNEIDEVGATRDDFVGTGVPSRELLFEIRFTAATTGTAIFSSNTAELLALESTVFDFQPINGSLDLRKIPGAIEFGETQITIVGPGTVPRGLRLSGGALPGRSAMPVAANAISSQVESESPAAVVADFAVAPTSLMDSSGAIPHLNSSAVGLPNVDSHASLKDNLLSVATFSDSDVDMSGLFGLYEAADEAAQDEIYRELGDGEFVAVTRATATLLPQDNLNRSFDDALPSSLKARNSQNASSELEPVLAQIAAEVRLAWQI